MNSEMDLIQASREPFMCMNLWILILPETHDMIRYFVPDWFIIRPIYVYKWYRINIHKFIPSIVWYKAFYAIIDIRRSVVDGEVHE